jgi:hypothetical protein
MTDQSLSPAAQAVLNALYEGFYVATPGQCLAAALRAAADQVVPEEIDLPSIAPDLGHFRQHERRLTRRRLLAIATELDNTSQLS